MLGRRKADKKKRSREQKAGDGLYDSLENVTGQYGSLENVTGQYDGLENVTGLYGSLENVTGLYDNLENVTGLYDGLENAAGLYGGLDDVVTKQNNGLKDSAEQYDGLEVITRRLAGSTAAVEIGTASILGSRKSQQDAVFGYAHGGRAIGIVCDGMGGLLGGEIASRAALESIADAWFAHPKVEDIPQFLRSEAVRADEKVYWQESVDGMRLNAGTTVVAVMIENNELYWLSVGDSKLYFIQGREILSLNVEHNYRMELNARLRDGTMTAQEYEAEEYQAEALTSYLGIGNLSLMDISTKAYKLQDQDIILLASDGLYRSLSEDEILAIVRENDQDMQKAAETLTASVQGRKKQDNTSVVLLRVCLGRQPKEKT